MTRFPWRLLAVVLLCVSAGCVLYTDRINVPPTVEIVPPPQTMSRGAAGRFHAEGHDDQSAALSYRWGTTAGGCPEDDTLPQGATLLSGMDATFDVTVESSGDYCVFVEVTDSQTATGHATRTVHVGDRAPVPAITQVAGPTIFPLTPPTTIPLFSELRFSGLESTDPDPGDRPVAFSWALTLPDRSVQRPPPECADLSDDTCFSVDQPGTYVLELTVTDDEGTPSTSSPVSFSVANDQPPCITDSLPTSFEVPGQDPAEALSFTITGVRDDGDPLPAPLDRPSQRSFVWSWRVGNGVSVSGEFTRIVNNDLAAFQLPPNSFLPGQTLQVRVEAHDRVLDRNEFDECLRAAPQPRLCAVGAGCNGWVTWTVGFQ